MIAYFPDAYENELLYSWLARYYQKSGYIAYRDVAEDLFVKPTVRPDIEFINPLTEDVIKMLCRNSRMEDVVLNHTMYSYYGRFLPLERRKEAFKTMVAMEGKMVDKFPMKLLNGKERYLKYCPLCVKEHRNKYGETYWSREHQCPDIRICTKHNVFLQDSTMNINYTSPNLVAAEMIIPEETPVIYNENELEYKISKYICEVFLAPVNFENDILYGKFLHNKLAGTKYLSKRGGAKRISELFKDITDYYADLEICKIEKLWHLEQIFTSHRFYLSDMVAIAYFLGISKEELLYPVIEVEDLTKQFDEQVRRLHEDGLNYMQIAKKLGSTYDMTKAIGEGLYQHYHYERRKKKERNTRMDWEQMDKDLQAEVRKVVEKIYGVGNARPKRVTVHNVATELNIPVTRLKMMPRCLTIINAKQESYEEYFARESVWAAKIIIKESKELNYTAISKLTNLRRKHFDACKPYLNEFTDEELAERIRQL